MGKGKDRIKKLMSRFSEATIRAAMADRPEVMQASGWNYGKDGKLVQDSVDSPGAEQLRKNLADIAYMPLSDMALATAGSAVAGTKAYKAYKLAKEIKAASKEATFVDDVVRNAQPKEVFRADVYKGGEIRDPYFASFTTDPEYAANYGEVNRYIVEGKPAVTTEPLMGSSDPVTRDMFVDRSINSDYSKTAIVGHDKLTGEFPRQSRGTEVISISPKNSVVKIKEPSTYMATGEDILTSLDDISAVPEPVGSGYSGTVPVKPSDAEIRFVRDVNEGAKWGFNRGSVPAPKSNYVELSQNLPINSGTETFVYDVPGYDGRVLKVLDGSADPGFSVAYSGYKTPEEAVDVAEAFARRRNAKPYNLPLAVEGYTTNSYGTYSPVLSQKKVTIPNESWLNNKDKVVEFARRIGTEELPELGRWDIPINNILVENDIVPPMKYGIDFKPNNLGVLPDGTIMGIDLRRNGGLLHTYPNGGKFFVTNLQDESPLMYQPILPSVPQVPVPIKYEPEPNYGDYVYPTSTGMIQKYPIQTTFAPVVQDWSETVPDKAVDNSVDLFSDEARAERRLMQRYVESRYNDNAGSEAGAKGPWQIMDITLKDYLGRGRGKQGNIYDPEYNGGIRDWVMSIIPRDLGEFWSENDSDINKLAKLYAAYNWGAGNLKKFLRARLEAGLSNDDPYEWVEAIKNKGKRPDETKNYVKFLALNQDIPGTYMTREKFEDLSRKKGYMAKGGKIHIKPENRGKFTALKKRTGHSASWFKAHGTPAQKKMAVFALNAKKWKHGDGGLLDRIDKVYGNDTEKILQAIQNARSKQK